MLYAVGFFEPDGDKMKANAERFLGWFFALGCGALVCVTLRVSLFTRVGEKMTHKLRLLSFQASHTHTHIHTHTHRHTNTHKHIN